MTESLGHKRPEERSQERVEHRTPSPVLVSMLAVLVLLGVGSWSLGLRVDAHLHDAYATRLRRVETLEHRLNEQVLRKYAGLAGSYDPIVVTLRELTALHDDARDVPAFIDAEGREEVLASLADSQATLAVQESVVERFKTENAVLLNSLRYFPLGADELADSLAERPGSELQTAEIRELLSDVLRMSIAPTEVAVSEVNQHVEALQSQNSDESELRLVLRHAGLIAEGRRTVDGLLAELLHQPGAARANRVSATYAREHQRALLRARRGELCFLAFVIVAVAAIAMSIIARMRSDAAAIRRASAKVAEAVDQQNRFVSMTSHEFRTPLSVIVSSTDLLRAYGAGWSRDQHEKHLARIERSARGMTDLLDGILLIGRTDAGHRDFRPGPMDLSALATEVVEAQRLRAKSGVSISLTNTTSEEVVLDPRLMRHVLDNLVGNAVKYSREGETVTVVVTRESEGIRVDVKDRGIGIPLADQARLFNTFHRAANVGSIQGTGLGLAIVKRAVDLHGGTISVVSTAEEWTHFEVRIPTHLAPQETHVEPTARAVEEAE